MRKQGSVHQFSETKGYGFITGDDGIEYYLHVSAIQGGAKSLPELARVAFDAVTGPKGPQAANVAPA